jgi:hypothetical protein
MKLLPLLTRLGQVPPLEALLPVDPQISLGVKVPDALGTIGNYAEIQNKLNQNKLFQQTFAARQRAGEILASAPDMESGLEQLYKDPVTAPFAGETVNQVRAGQQTFADVLLKRQQEKTSAAEATKAGADTAKTLQDTASSGYQAALGHAIPALLASPDDNTWNNVVQPQLGLLSPQARKAVEPILNDLKTSLLADIPPDMPVEQKRALVQRRVAAIGLGSGVTPEAISTIGGKPTTVNQGSQITGAVERNPLFAGGQGVLSPSGSSFGIGAPPKYASGPGDTTFPVPAIQPGQASGPTNSITGVLSGSRPPGPGPGPGISGSPLPSGGTGEVPAPSPAVSYTGRPLYDSHTPMLAPKVGTAAGGLPLLSSAQQKNADKLMEDFSDSGLRAFNNANTTLGSLESMSHDLDQLASTGGLLTPGTASQFRSDVAKSINTLADTVGLKEPFDPKALASVEAFNKETNRMGLTVLTTMLGNQREAAQTINNITTKAVPGIDNTYMGGKMVIEGLKATTQRAIDQRNWENEWQRRNQGNLSGADEAFNARFPAKDYADSALAKFGMNEKGFLSPDAVKAAWQSGFMTRDQALAVLKKQFGEGK